jgi:uncharacterized protein with PIN domain
MGMKVCAMKELPSFEEVIRLGKIVSSTRELWRCVACGVARTLVYRQYALHRKLVMTFFNEEQDEQEPDPRCLVCGGNLESVVDPDVRIV